MRFHQLKEAMFALVKRRVVHPENADFTLLDTAQKFYLGDINQLPDIDFEEKDFPKLPFPVVAFEFELLRRHDYRESWIVVAEEPENISEVKLHIWFKERVIGWLPAGVCTVLRFPPHKIVHYFDGLIESRADEKFKKSCIGNCRGIVTCTAIALQVLNCVNVSTDVITPSDKLNKKRTKSNKIPVYKYHVLVLRRGAQKSSSLGGTHASPPVHLVRGHIKRRKTGNFWWQSHVAGNPERGIVEKDYRADELIKKFRPGEPHGDTR